MSHAEHLQELINEVIYKHKLNIGYKSNAANESAIIEAIISDSTLTHDDMEKMMALMFDPDNVDKMLNKGYTNMLRRIEHTFKESTKIDEKELLYDRLMKQYQDAANTFLGVIDQLLNEVEREVSVKLEKDPKYQDLVTSSKKTITALIKQVQVNSQSAVEDATKSLLIVTENIETYKSTTQPMHGIINQLQKIKQSVPTDLNYKLCGIAACLERLKQFIAEITHDEKGIKTIMFQYTSNAQDKVILRILRECIPPSNNTLGLYLSHKSNSSSCVIRSVKTLFSYFGFDYKENMANKFYFMRDDTKTQKYYTHHNDESFTTDAEYAFNPASFT